MRSKTQNSQEAVPSHVLLSPLDNSNILNFVNFNNLGSSTLSSSSAFKKIQFSSKTNPQNLFQSSDDFSLKYNKIYDLYISDMNAQDSTSYGISRQHNYSSSKSINNNFSTQLDNKSVGKLLSYNYNYGSDSFGYSNSSDFETTSLKNGGSKSNSIVNNVSQGNSYISGLDKSLLLGKEFLNSDQKQQSYIEGNLDNNYGPSNITTINKEVEPSNLMFDYSVLYKNFINKSPNQQILSSDMNIRNLDNLNPNKVNYNISNNYVGLSNFMDNVKYSSNQTSKQNTIGVVNSASTVFPDSHMPSSSMNSKMSNLGYDKFSTSGLNSNLMTSKEELAPNFVFTPF